MSKIDETLDYVVPFILGDADRQSILTKLFTLLQQKQVILFIITNNREKYFDKMLSFVFRILNIVFLIFHVFS